MSTRAKTGTIDNPAKTTIAAEYYISTEGDDGLPALVVDIDLTKLGGRRWKFDSIIDVDPDGTISLLCYPDDDDEGWSRLIEVGEW